MNRIKFCLAMMAMDFFRWAEQKAARYHGAMNRRACKLNLDMLNATRRRRHG